MSNNYTIGFLTLGGGPQRFFSKTITGAPSRDSAVSLFTVVMKYVQIVWVVESQNERDFACPVDYCELERNWAVIAQKSEYGDS